jgi:hypothetical protein
MVSKRAGVFVGAIGPLPLLCLFLVSVTLAPHRPVSAPTPDPACSADKISFTQETGCLNDGSIEFCLPADDPAALATVRRIVPSVTCLQSRGRARCDPHSQRLCLVDTRGMCRTDSPRAMTDAGWRTVCDLARLPFVRKVVPTWYE